MNLAERLNAKSFNEEMACAVVSNEIISYFKEIFDSGRMEAAIEAKVTREDKINRSLCIPVEFWSYHSGCSPTNFRVGYFSWYNPENREGYNSTIYKRVSLNKVHKDICARLLNMSKEYLRSYGFNMTIEDKESWLGYYHKNIIIRW